LNSAICENARTLAECLLNSAICENARTLAEFGGGGGGGDFKVLCQYREMAECKR